MAPTIKDVAKKANVSIATVSLVINNHKRISDGTKRKVNKAIRELKYHPSRSARGLVSRQTGNIGFILTEDHFLRSEPFYTRVFLGTEFEARQNEHYIFLTTIPSTFSKDDKLPRFVVERNVDGVIIAGKVPDEIIARLQRYELPLAFVDYYSPDQKYSVVLIDNISGGLMATQHLIDLGHRKVGFIGGDINHPSINDRYQGYKLALERASIPFDERLTIIDEDYPARENGYRGAEKLLKKYSDLTAIFTCNDAMAIGVMQYLKDKKFNIPKDISLIGFDDVEADLSLDPPLTTIRVPKIEMGVEVMRIMSEILKNKTNSAKKILVPVEVVVRKSTSRFNSN